MEKEVQNQKKESNKFYRLVHFIFVRNIAVKGLALALGFLIWFLIRLAS